MMDATNSPTKKCSKCGVVKERGEFHLCRKASDGLQPYCRACKKKSHTARKEANPERFAELKRAAARRWRERHPEASRAAAAAWRKKNPERVRMQGVEWRRKNPERDRARTAAWYAANRDRERARAAAWNKAHHERHRAYQVAWRQAHRGYFREWEHNAYKSDVAHRLGKVLRRRLWYALRNGAKTGSAVRDLGCTIDELKAQLERQFQPGMTWDNYGTWHIDHIKPLSAFDLTNRDELLQACHFSNLQPLWGVDNIRKGGVRRKSQKVSAG